MISYPTGQIYYSRRSYRKIGLGIESYELGRPVMLVSGQHFTGVLENLPLWQIFEPEIFFSHLISAILWANSNVDFELRAPSCPL